MNHFLIGRVLLFVYIYIWNIFFFGEETLEKRGDSSEEEREKKVKKKVILCLRLSVLAVLFCK